MKMYGVVERSRRIGSVWREVKPRCEVVVGEQRVKAIVDTGSDATILLLRTAPAKPPTTNLTMANGQNQMTAQGPADVIEKWEHLLIGRRFKIKTDHRPLQWLKTKMDLPSKLWQMALRLMEFDIESIEYVKGKDNIIADALNQIVVGLIRVKPSDTLATLMQRDPKRFIRKDGKVFLTERTVERLCIDDADEKTKILKTVHDEEGHLGFFKSAEVIRERFFWPH